MKHALRFLRTLSPAKVFDYMLLQISFGVSRLTGRSLHIGLPASISVEPTTSCNLRCPECPSGLRHFTRPQGKIDQGTFKNIIDQLHTHLIYLMMYFQGEPLLVPEFYDMLSYASKKGVFTATSTNGHYLDDSNARRLIESGLDKIIISMDGVDQETYGQYRVGGDLERVKEGVRNLVKWKKQLGSGHPYIILQFLVFKNNEHQMSEMRTLARRLEVDKLEFKSAQIYKLEKDHHSIPENQRFARYKLSEKGLWKIKNPLRNRCFRMWSGAVITWDGLIVPCCFDKDAKYQFGRLSENTFKDIWRSKTYQDFRSQILKDRSAIDICGNCTE